MSHAVLKRGFIGVAIDENPENKSSVSYDADELSAGHILNDQKVPNVKLLHHVGSFAHLSSVNIGRGCS